MLSQSPLQFTIFDIQVTIAAGYLYLSLVYFFAVFIYLLINHIKKVRNGQNANRNPLLKALYKTESEKKFFLEILDQLSANYHIQFSTPISAFIQGYKNDTVIDILLVDPVSLKPKLALFISDNCMQWCSAHKGPLLASFDLLNDLNIPTVSIPKQDFYKTNDIVKRVLDALNNNDEEQFVSFYNKLQKNHKPV